jgi:hypothetical protein
MTTEYDGSFRINRRLAALIWAALIIGSAQAAMAYDLTFSSYLGGSAFEMARDVCSDASGNIFVTGGTLSPDFPILNGTPVNTKPLTDPTNPQNMDVFVAKFTPTGQLVWSTALGGRTTTGPTTSQ